MGGTDPGVFDLVRGWDGLGVVVRFDRPTGSWVFVAIHDDTMGRPTGGCRMRVYDTPEDGLRDALRLAEGMTAKWATINLPFGGGKAVLAVPHLLEGSAREGLLLRFARLLNSLKGAFGTGEDLGTTPADMHLLATVTPYAIGAHPLTGGLMDPGPFTAGGVLAAIQAALVHRNGSGSLAGRAVLIQGGGDVGAPLARLVAEGGAQVLIADVDPKRAAALAAETGGQVIAPDDVYDTACDVYAPCAIGGTLNRQTIPRLRCRIVAGSANNQLEEVDDAERLKERGVLYAPDFVVNAGGAMAFGLLILGLTDEVELSRRVEGLGKGLGEIFTEAHERGESPLPAARRRVERVLARARAAPSPGLEGS